MENTFIPFNIDITEENPETVSLLT